MISIVLHRFLTKLIFCSILSTFILSLYPHLNAKDLIRFRWEKENTKAEQVKLSVKEKEPQPHSPKPSEPIKDAVKISRKVPEPIEKSTRAIKRVKQAHPQNQVQEGIRFRWENKMTEAEIANQENPPYLQTRQYQKSIRLSQHSPEFNRINLIPVIAQEEYPTARRTERIHRDDVDIIQVPKEEAFNDINLTEGQDENEKSNSKGPRRRKLKLPTALAREYVGNVQLTNPEEVLVFFNPEKDKEKSDTRVAVPVKGNQGQAQEADFKSDANYQIK